MRPMLEHRTRVLARMEISASMTPYTTTANKDDDESHDTCPTCGGHVETKAKCDESGHTYDLTCTVCPWSVPLSQPPTTRRDGAVVMTDGGTTAETTEDGGPQTAREILDDLHSDDSVARVAAQIKTGDGNAMPDDVLRTLGLAEDRLCLTVEFRTGIEYIWLADGWRHLVAQKVRPNGDVLDPIPLSMDDLENRVEKPLDVELVGSTPIPRPETEADS